MCDYAKLLTPEGENISEIPWNVYPRPQLVRDSFFCLNGLWDFEATDGKEPIKYNKKILVPFSPETILSGINQTFADRTVFWYKRSFSLPENFVKAKTILHIGAADQKATVYLNGYELGSHTGGYEHFSFDISNYIKEENEIVIKVCDNLSAFTLPYGKQSQKRGGMWYTPTSGIWQTVWVESVPENYIEGLKIETFKNGANITVFGAENGVITLATPTGNAEFELKDGKAKIRLETPELWSPENPYLYYFNIKTETDCVSSYFAIRTLEIKEINGAPRLCLNSKPYFFHGLLDQGYYSDGLLTPASPKSYEKDILKMKSLGFNMLRKHIKVEPEQFYFDCDRLGMVVFQDMVNNGDYSFLRDTALPTIGIKKLGDKNMHKDTATRKAFINSMEATVTSLYNHPSICYWTIFNEGWGQFCSSEMYNRLKAIDSSRFIDSASGWFMGGKTDVDSQHIYFKKLKLKIKDKPLVLSEFGGYSYKPENHVFNLDKTYGYGKFETREEFVTAICNLYKEQVLPLAKSGLSATVYTQVSDVEDETNGLLSFDRKVLKLLPEEFLNISKHLTSNN